MGASGGCFICTFSSILIAITAVTIGLELPCRGSFFCPASYYFYQHQCSRCAPPALPKHDYSNTGWIQPGAFIFQWGNPILLKPRCLCSQQDNAQERVPISAHIDSCARCTWMQQALENLDDGVTAKSTSDLSLPYAVISDGIQFAHRIVRQCTGKGCRGNRWKGSAFKAHLWKWNDVAGSVADIFLIWNCSSCRFMLRASSFCKMQSVVSDSCSTATLKTISPAFASNKKVTKAFVHSIGPSSI